MLLLGVVAALFFLQVAAMIATLRTATACEHTFHHARDAAEFLHEIRKDVRYLADLAEHRAQQEAGAGTAVARPKYRDAQ